MGGPPPGTKALYVRPSGPRHASVVTEKAKAGEAPAPLAAVAWKRQRLPHSQGYLLPLNTTEKVCKVGGGAGVVAGRRQASRASEASQRCG